MLDSHCHLAGEEFVADLGAVVDRATAAGVTDALCIIAPEDEAEVARAKTVRGAWAAVRFATGIHPHNAVRFGNDVNRGVDTVRRAIAATGACAVGEIGLDYHYDYSPRGVQEQLFRAQIRLARELSLPIIIHTREAAEDTFRVLTSEGGSAIRGVFHCFTGDAAMAERALDLGFYISFAGILTFPRASDLREIATKVPRDRLLSETDAPYLAPTPHRGTRNEPAFVTRVVETLATLHGVEVSAMAAQIRANFQQLFGLAR
jgi:TatD DNase family protein